MIEIFIDWSPGEARVAAMMDGHLVDFAIWRPSFPDGLGDVHRLRITRAAPSMKGGFAQLPSGADAFVAGQCNEGDFVTARVTRAAQGGKGPRLQVTSHLPEASDPDRLLLGPNILEEIAARYPDSALHLDDPSLAARIPKSLRPRVRRVLKAFHSEIEDQCAALGQPHVPLGDGISARFTPTSALFAIDLDDAAINDARTQFSRNMVAFEALARQIVARNLGGVILIDPAGVPTRKRPALVSHLQAACAHDPLSPHGFGSTPSGLLELTRPRRRPPLHELLSSAQGVGLAALRDITRGHHADTGHKSRTLNGSKSLIAALESDPDAVAETARILGSPLQLMPHATFSLHQWSFA